MTIHFSCRWLPAVTLGGLLLLLDGSPARAEGAADPSPALQGTALARYMVAPEPAFAWRVVSEGRLRRTSYAELIVTSLTWHGFDWNHQLLVFVPDRLDVPASQGLLFIHGGRWRPELAAGWSGPIPARIQLFARLAETLRAPVGVLLQVPQQPLLGRTEDALIAHTFDRFLETGDESWPLLLPMAKSAARGLDALQQVLDERWQLEVKHFTVAGASKRGWTAWLAAAADPRINSVAPMVIDMLDLPAQIQLQRATFGQLSEQVRDYEDIRLPERLDTPRGQQLLDLVDPYRYRDRLESPKLIVLATNDRYWPVDALNIYWDALSAPKNVLYVPNQGHGIRDVGRLISGLAALHGHAARGEPLPSLTGTFESTGRGPAWRVVADRAPGSVRLWSAHSATPDFRDARWSSRACRRSGDGWRCPINTTAGGYAALFAEARWRERGRPTFELSTTLCMLEADRLDTGCIDRRPAPRPPPG